MTRGMLGDKYVKRNDVKRRGTGKPPPPARGKKTPFGGGGGKQFNSPSKKFGFYSE
jgi:hypothetical protein